MTSTTRANATAAELWEQLFGRMAEADDAALVDPQHDEAADRAALRAGLSGAGWTESEIAALLRQQDEEIACAPVTSPGASPHVEVHLRKVCEGVEAAMERLGIQSYSRVARGIEPRAGSTAAMTNVIMTDQGMI